MQDITGLIWVFAQLEANLAQQRTRERIVARQAEDGYDHSRPPLGFETDDGHLVEGKGCQIETTTSCPVRTVARRRTNTMVMDALYVNRG